MVETRQARARQARRTTVAAPNPVPAFFLYGEPLQAPDERTIHVETIATRSRLYDWHIRPHRHRDLYQVLLIHRGRTEVQLDDQTTVLPAPAVAIVPPGTVHGFRFQANCVGIVATFAASLARDLGLGVSEDTGFLERATASGIEPTAAQATDLAPLGEMLLREFGRSAAGRQMALRGLLAALLASVQRLLRDSSATDAPAAARERELVARFRQSIERHYRQHASIAQYATKLGTSETRLRRACLAIAGQSPVELIHSRLVVEAERQLRYTSMSITQIAYYLGYEDPAYFSRFFTHRLRMSPRAFRARCS